MTATIETNLWQRDLIETESNEVSEWAVERQKNRAEELRSRSLLRRSSPQSVRGFLWPSDSTDGFAQRRGCALACESAGDSAGSPTAMLLFFGVG